jgi:lipopolysaccharide transport system permease protein
MHLSQYFRLADVMARMNLRADATKFILGYIWWVLEPLLYVAVFYVVFSYILTNRQPDFLYFLMTGKLVFIWFSKSITQASNSIVAGKGLIGQINIPKTLFPLASVQEGLYKQVAVFVLLMGVLLYSGFEASPVWLYMLPLLLVTYIIILACAYVGATLVCIMRDFSQLIPMGMIFLMFTSGVFWNVRSLDDPAKIEAVLTYNPLAFLLDAYRQVLMYATPPDVIHLLAIGAGAGMVLCVMVVVMRRYSQFLALKALTA